MRVIVTGGRHYTDIDTMRHVIDRLVDESGGRLLVVQGGARGADRLCRIVCQQARVACATFPADWDRYGRAAGPTRNQTMLDVTDPDLVVVFPGGAGTADMATRASRASIPVRHPG